MLYGLLGGESSAYIAPKIKQLVADFADVWLSDVPAALRLKPGSFQFSGAQNRARTSKPEQSQLIIATSRETGHCKYIRRLMCYDFAPDAN